MTINNKQQLIDSLAQGNKFDFVFFGGEGLAQQVDARRCFSQWYMADFEVDGHRFVNSAHYVMAAKAKLFGDDEAYHKLLAVSSTDDIQTLGRSIQGFNEQLWLDNRMSIVETSVEQKFAQNPILMAFLKDSADKVIAEANPVDKIWATGVAEDDANATNPAEWRGDSLLGFVIMAVRSRLLAG